LPSDGRARPSALVVESLCNLDLIGQNRREPTALPLSARGRTGGQRRALAIA
jgi:kynurenine formamidase